MEYADDCNIYVGSERAGHRVMESVTHFITRRLKLKVNQAKSAVARPGQRKFLGFSFTGEPEPRRRIAPKAMARFKGPIREQTRRTRGISLQQMVKAITTYLRGWLGYFGDCQTPTVLHSLEAWTNAVSRASKGGVVWTWRCKPPVALTARGGSRTRPLCPLPYPTPPSPCSGFRLWSCSLSLIRRTAGCGPACPVVWEGRAGDCSPYRHWRIYGIKDRHPDEQDPSGVQPKAALKALAYQFLNLAGRKHIPVVVRLKELQPGDSHAICAILVQCCDILSDQVYGSLDQPERTDALRLLATQIGNRYEDRQLEGPGLSELSVLRPIDLAHQ
jgi:hypothetical protein